MAADVYTPPQHLRVETHDDRIAVVQLDRPPVNAVNQDMYREIKARFEELGARDDLSAIILTGSGKHFCAGNDLEEFKTLSPVNSLARMREVREAFWAIHDCPVPVIAAVHGVALGTGLALVASCDFAIAAEDAQLGVTEISVGVMGAAKHLARLVPQPVVRAMFFTGDPMPVTEIQRLGGVIEVVPAERLLEEAMRWARAVTRHSPLAIRFAKQALNRIEFMELKPGYEYEQGLTGELSGSKDAKEALAAFFEHRAPAYEGC
jgi:enoyl-CoA hydratase